MKLEPNTTQLALASFAAHGLSFKDPKRINICLRAGGGKTRVAVSIAWIAIKKNIADEVTFLHPY